MAAELTLENPDRIRYEKSQSATRLGTTIRKYYPRLNQAEYIETHLSQEEIDLIDKTSGLTPRDYRTLAKVKDIIYTRQDLAQRFDSCRPLNFQHYMAEQWAWMKVEEWLVSQSIDPTLPEDQKKSLKTRLLIEDFNENKNGLRFKMFYCMKYPSKVSW
jgi:hypothetical protein